MTAKKATTCLCSSLTHEELLGVLSMRWWDFDQTHQSKALETNKSLRGFHFIKRPCMNVLIDVDNLLTIGDRYWRNSESAFHFRLCRACHVPFMWAAHFCMGACKQDDVVVVIKIGALFVVLVFPTLSYETRHVLLALFTSHQTLFSRVLGDYCMSCVPWQGHTVELSFRIKLCQRKMDMVDLW